MMATCAFPCFHSIAARMSCFVIPLQIVLRSVVYWQLVVIVQVLQQGRYDARLYKEHTPVLSSTVDGEVGQSPGSIQEAVMIWLGARRIVALVPARGLNPEKVTRRRTTATLHVEDLITAGDNSKVSGGLRKESVTAASHKRISVAEPSGIPSDWRDTRAEIGEAAALGATGHATYQQSIRRTSGRETASKAADAAEQPAPQTALISLNSTDFIIQPFPDMWICRLSNINGPCGWRSWGDIPPRRSCVSAECCSKTYCRELGQCGDWCIKNDFLCLINDGDYSYGKCSCANYVQRCDPDAECRDRPEPLGGAFCECHEGFYGNGQTCKPDPCHMSPCSPGDCRRPVDDSAAYTCSCPPNYTAETTAEGHQACIPKANICLTEPCGSEGLDCVSFDNEYECICNDGFIYNETTCVEIDWCAGDPCGPSEAVHVCVSNVLDYSCFCRQGYAVVTDTNGAQRCQKDPCGDNACGPLELVQSCTVKKDEADEIVGYKCVCTDIASLQQSSDSDNFVCKLRDLCTDDPCGPPEAAVRCYMEDYSYQCVCQPGYTPSRRNGKVRCIRGDPCSTGACGDSPLVEECLTDGTAYTCTCVTGKAFLSRRRGDRKEYCEDISVCTEWCGNLFGLESCLQDEDGKVNCKCGPGYVRVNTDGGPSCVEGDICTTEPCGSSEAVLECNVKGDDTYSCLCKDGFELRHLSDTNQEVCAARNSCLGDPCREAGAVDCVEGDTTYECICEDPYTFRRDSAGGRCVLVSDTPTAPENPHESTGETPKTEGSELSLWILGACAGAGVLVLFLVGSGVAFGKSTANGDDVSDEMSNYLPGDQPQRLPSASDQVYLQGLVGWNSTLWR